MKNEQLLIIGCGDHSKVVTEIAEALGVKNIQYLDQLKTINNFLGRKTYTKINENFIGNFIVAIGDNFLREKVYLDFINKYKAATPINLFHPKSIVSPRCKFGQGNVIISNSTVNSSSKIGNGVIINTSSSVDHDCYLKDFCSLAPGVNIGGNVVIGKRTFISIGAKIMHGINIGNDNVIGGCSFVNKDIEDNCVCYGVPSKVIRKRNSNEKYL